MTSSTLTDDELLAYLDEGLPVERMAVVEKALRESDVLRRRAAGLARRRDQGAHTVGEIWRRWRLSCPTRKQLGSYLLGVLDPELARYFDFHIRTIGCRYCAANLRDLEASAQTSPETEHRRRKFFQSSAGFLRSADDET